MKIKRANRFRLLFFLGVPFLLGYQNCAKINLSGTEAAASGLSLLSPVDNTCASGTPISIPVENLELHCRSDANAPAHYISNGFAHFLFPKKNPIPQSVPASCLRGFEVNNLKENSVTIRSLASTGTTRRMTLEVDFATYVAPDGSRLIAKNADGSETVVFDSCHMRTACYGDPTSGQKRPYEDSIRSFLVDLPRGTVSLTLDHENASTPTYMRILGLCEFDLSRLPANLSGTRFGLVNSRTVSPMGYDGPATATHQY